MPRKSTVAVARTFRGSPRDLEIERPIGQRELDYLVLQLDPRCPHACTYCFVGTKLNDPRALNLDFEERKRIVTEASELGARVVSLPGAGEPLAIPYTKELIEHANKLGLAVVVYTKGLLLTKQWTDFLAVHDATIILSLDSLDEETAVNLNPRPVGWYPRMLENVAYARRVFAPLAVDRRNVRVTRLVVNHIVCRRNYGQQQAIREWCGDDLLFVCHGPSREGFARQHWQELGGDNGEHQALIAYANQHSDTSGNTTARLDGKCAYYLNGITIDHDGNVKLCPAASSSSGKMRNARDLSLRELRNEMGSLFRRALGDNPPACVVRSDSYESVLRLL